VVVALPAALSGGLFFDHNERNGSDAYLLISEAAAISALRFICRGPSRHLTGRAGFYCWRLAGQQIPHGLCCCGGSPVGRNSFCSGIDQTTYSKNLELGHHCREASPRRKFSYSEHQTDQR